MDTFGRIYHLKKNEKTLVMLDPTCNAKFNNIFNAFAHPLDVAESAVRLDFFYFEKF